MSMDIYEIISPHVAIPIVCVLICALLVFAFGFKAPAQPPSFDYNEDRRLRKNKRLKEKHKTSLHSNGQVSSDETKYSLKHVGKTNSSVISRHRGWEVDGYVNHDDTVTVGKKSSKGGAVAEDGQGEWTTFVSRKDKKQRGGRREEDEGEGMGGDRKGEVTTPQGKGKKSKKKSNEAASASDLQLSEPSPVTTPVPPPIPIPEPPPPPPKLYDIEIDIQTLDKKAPINVPSIQKPIKSPKKKEKDKRKDKKEMSPVKDTIAEPSQNAVKVSSSSPVIPSKDGPTEDQPKPKKKKARREN